MARCMDGHRCPKGVLEVFERSRSALTLVDPTLDDQPLVMINKRFCEATRYPFEEALGRNCRFLQRNEDCGNEKVRIREFLSDRTKLEGRFILPNRTRDGELFLNVIYLSRLRRSGQPDLILGSQFVASKGEAAMRAYEFALQDDLVSLGAALNEQNWMLMGSMQAVANTSRLLAQHQLDKGSE